jgi:hypothetical protein
MTTFPNSPRLIKGGIVLVDPESGVVQRIIPLQYNPDSLSRTLQVQGVGGEAGGRAQALRLKGPPVETLKLEAEMDATDRLEFPQNHPDTVQHGIAPDLAALETLIYPASSRLQQNHRLAQSGTLEIAPLETPLTLLVWSRNRIVPVRITEFSITEEAFDPWLNPIRARVSLGMRVLSIDDLGFGHRGGHIYLSYQQNKEALAGLLQAGTFTTLGIGGLP